ncbi:GATA zinc finger domain-containing protein 14-like [Cydia amplana]|uniref:GATA zinc finger domain-containing protein 14-like n=1 Tax=Cydia amplana TaxID=1869771 RepID=UPI002FE66844
MKSPVLALFCAIALVSAELNENGCPINPYVDILKPHPNCNKYYQCVQGELYERPCASDLLFNEETQECDWAINVDCGNRPIAPEGSGESGNDSKASGDSSESGNNSSSNEDSETSESNSSSNESGNNGGGGNGNPSEAPIICAAEGSNGVLVAHENCNQFYKCAYGVPVALDCNSNLLYNIEKEQCDWPENVNCEGRNQGGNDDNGNGKSVEDSNNEEEEADKEDGNNDNNNNNGGGNGNPSEAREICAAEGSDGVLVAHENCNQFYKCSEGSPVALDCPLNLLYNYANEQCDWPENVNCEGRNQGGNGDNGNGKSVEDSSSEEAEKEDGNNDNNNNNGGGNGNPSEAREICAAEGSDGVLVAHENCNQFYKCSEGSPVALDCPSNLLYNYANEQCDWPENVNCEGRNQGGNGDNGNGKSVEDSNNEEEEADKEDGNNDNNNNNGGGNGNPSEAREICAAEGSDGVLVAHENCNQFYKCSEGSPVALDCPLNLLYNYANEQCDWPDNVNCEGRNQGGNGDNGNGKSVEDSSSEEADKEVGNNDNNNNNGGGNGNPSEASEICAAEGSDGVLVAHENCNQFYKCSEGSPVALDCPLNLLYNYANEQCDWPENVNCEDRNQGGNGDNGNGKSVEDSNNEEEEADKEDGNNDNNNDNSGGNGNPSEAREICAAEGSDGVLVAHENCNQFYKCSEGSPVALDCPLNLLYNYANEQCDWPENVNCEGRNQGGNGDNDNGKSVEDSSSEEADKEDGNNDNNNNGGGNGNPSDAPEICAKDGSDSVLVAHENCNQYYVCRDGLPVTLDCNPNLVFNPDTDQCDWPELVDCGNRRTFTSLNKHLHFIRM